MAAATKVVKYSNQLVILMDDGSRQICYPTSGGLWYSLSGTSKIKEFGNSLQVMMAGVQNLAVDTGNDLWTITAGGGGPIGGTRFIWPFDPTTTTTDEYGPRPPLPFHNGLDFGAGGVGDGSEIIAMGAGVVTISQTWDGTTDPSTLQALGNYLRISHGTVLGHTLLTGYAHARNPPAFAVGDIITQGQILGLVSDTGYSFGAHLHLETWDDGTRINPRDWMTAYANA